MNRSPVEKASPGNHFVAQRKGTSSASRAASLFALLLILLAGMSSKAQTEEQIANADFFVALDGKDDWSGRFARPDQGRTDGPFATLGRARDAVRELRKSSAKKDFVVKLRGGLYRLKETVVFSLEDSAPGGGTITYAAYSNERPVLSSGVPIRNWRRLVNPPENVSAAARNKLWVADLPPDLEKCLTLYNGNERLPRARGAGFAPPEHIGKKTSADKIAFPTNAMRNWPDLKEGELLVLPSVAYEMSILPLASVDETARVATTTVPASRAIGKVQFFPVSAWAENILDLLDQPGEWVVNRKERRIYFWPRGDRPGENIVAPRLTELVRVEGRIDYAGTTDEPVRGLVFRGLTFSHAERFQWHGFTGWNLQHHWEMFDRPTAALRFRGADGCAVQACRFTATSGTAVRLDLHCQKNRIVDNEIDHIGGVGVLLAGYGPGTKDVNRQNEVRNNWIHHTGEIYWAMPAIVIWQSGENRVTHNLIHNTPYSGITISTRTGWSMKIPTDGKMFRSSEVGDLNLDDWSAREPFTHSRRNRVEQNDIHDVMEKLIDGDGIYISGAGKENLLRQNYIHDNDSDHMADGIRCDDDQHETIIEGNVICRVRCMGQGICSKGVNHMINNVIVDLLPSRLPVRKENIVRGYLGLEVNPMTGSRVQRNIVVSRGTDFPPVLQHIRYGMGGEPRLRDCLADYNLYYCTEDSAWGRRHLEKEQPFGVETHSLSTDPLFVDLDKGDFRLKPESPARKLGIESIDISKAGLLPGHPYYRVVEKGGTHN